MTRRKPSRAAVPPSFFAKLLLPFAVPIALTFALLLLVGENWPRNIAPGSGLKLAGFVASAMTGALVWWWMTRGFGDQRIGKAAALMCGLTGLMGWPVWSVGVLPSVNGLALGPAMPVRMLLERTEVTTVSRSPRLNHWAWLRPQSPDAPVVAGRYFIPEATHARWNADRPSLVTLVTARGLLGAQVVVAYD